jgi:chromosome segregation ATPase
MQARQRAARARADAVRSLDQGLHTNTERYAAQEKALAAALDTATTLKKAMKASAKDRDSLRAARREARRAAAKADQRAATAEARYDRAVLADLVRREKDHDLSAHPVEPPAAHPVEPAEESGRAVDPGPTDRLVQALTPEVGDRPHSATTTRPRSETTG